jgi:hypothetical protein
MLAVTFSNKATAEEYVYGCSPAWPEKTHDMIQVIARLHGNIVIETRGSTGPDGLHLTGLAYRHVAGVFVISLERCNTKARRND